MMTATDVAPTSTNSTSAALDFSGSAERAPQLHLSDRIPMKMNGVPALLRPVNVRQHDQLRSPVGYGRVPAPVTTQPAHLKGRRPARLTTTSTYVSVWADLFGWGRTGSELTECYIGSTFWQQQSNE